jgi:hypothetical protein
MAAENVNASPLIAQKAGRRAMARALEEQGKTYHSQVTPQSYHRRILRPRTYSSSHSLHYLHQAEVRDGYIGAQKEYGEAALEDAKQRLAKMTVEAKRQMTMRRGSPACDESTKLVI